MNEIKSEQTGVSFNIYLDGKYGLVKQIGEGGFGGIFLAFNTESSSYCAIKLNRMEKTEEIESEIELMNYFDHPNVLHLDDFSIKKGKLKQENGNVVSETVSYLVMPYAHFGDLGSYLLGDSYFEEDIAVY